MTSSKGHIPGTITEAKVQIQKKEFFCAVCQDCADEIMEKIDLKQKRASTVVDHGSPFRERQVGDKAEQML